jgi:hypothetical protein
MHLKKVTLPLLMIFSISSSCALSPTATPAPPTPVHWEFSDLPDGSRQACLPEAEVDNIVTQLSYWEFKAAACEGN